MARALRHMLWKERADGQGASDLCAWSSSYFWGFASSPAGIIQDVHLDTELADSKPGCSGGSRFCPGGDGFSLVVIVQIMSDPLSSFHNLYFLVTYIIEPAVAHLVL